MNVTNLTMGIYRRIYAACCKGKRINSVSVAAELLFWRLHCVADDFGTFEADPIFIKTQALPRRKEITEKELPSLMFELESAKLIKTYEVNDEKYGLILDFDKMQPAPRNGKRIQKFPHETKGVEGNLGASKGIQGNPDSSKGDVLPHTHAHIQDQNHTHTQPPQPPELTGGLLENTTTATKTRAPKSTSNLPPGFLRFWSAWPKHQRKTGRTHCSEIWKRKQLEEHADFIVSMVEVCKKSEDWVKGYIPMPQTWLNQGRWDTEPENVATNPADVPEFTDIHTEAEIEAICGGDDAADD